MNILNYLSGLLIDINDRLNWHLVQVVIVNVKNKTMLYTGIKKAADN